MTMLERSFIALESNEDPIDPIDQMIGISYQYALNEFASDEALVDFNIANMESRSIKLMKKASMSSGKPFSSMKAMLREVAFVSAIDVSFAKLRLDSLMHDDDHYEYSSAVFALTRQIASALSKHVAIRHNGRLDDVKRAKTASDELQPGSLDVIIDGLHFDGCPIERKLYRGGVSFMTESLMFWLSAMFKLIDELDDRQSDSDIDKSMNVYSASKHYGELDTDKLFELANLILKTLVVDDKSFEDRFYYRDALGAVFGGCELWVDRICDNVKIIDQRTSDINDLYDEACSAFNDNAVVNKTVMLDYLKKKLKLQSVKVTASPAKYTDAYNSYYRKKIDNEYGAVDDLLVESLKSDYARGKSVQTYVWKSDADIDFLHDKTIFHSKRYRDPIEIDF